MSKKILVVEDEQALRDALVNKLKLEEFEVFEATNGKEGLDIAIDEKPDLILLDVIMPIMDGFSMTDKLRQYERESKVLVDNQIPIIYLTNLDEEKGRGEGQKHGVYDYLVKTNWKIEDVVKKVKDKLNL